jgi:hypothetical protein
MFRPVARALARAPAVAARSPASTRLISTAGPTSKSRSWKSTFARLGLAGGAIYYYNTSSAFAQEPSCTSCRRTRRFRLPSAPEMQSPWTCRILGSMAIWEIGTVLTLLSAYSLPPRPV